MDSFDSISNTIVIDYWEWIVHFFLSTHDPSQLMQYHQQFVQPSTMALKSIFNVDSFPPVDSCIDVSWLSKILHSLGLTGTIQATGYGFITISIQCAMISTIDTPSLRLSSSIIKSNVIIDTEVSVCILPHQSDFVTYATRTLKINDLSSSNRVAGEGLIHWSLQDINSAVVTLEIMGYHIPNADICLLSPQVLIRTSSGHALLNHNGMDISLDDDTILSANYCPRTNLPMVPLALSIMSMEPWYCFWSDAFGYPIKAYKEIVEIRSVLHQTNSNLYSSQKEVPLWHQHLSHASTNWIQTLMRDRKWLPYTNHVNATFHLGPSIVTRSCAPHCVVCHI